ncbi:hypothetical protein KSX_78800 [Ktedonospora formicarum]|uniref:Uncharacterized protein n=1 Tax=Ktedonospora formicarum TaxID=2778364 RepID=A0A8J3IBP1_9CHLR|nr:hypothetical protein KSX_78800 [Ktedonospora formicarum]
MGNSSMQREDYDSSDAAYHWLLSGRKKPLPHRAERNGSKGLRTQKTPMGEAVSASSIGDWYER